MTNVTLPRIPAFQCNKCDAIWRTEAQRDLCCTATEPEPTTISIVLATPPGVNRSYAPARFGKGIRKTTVANDWGAYAKWNVAVQRQNAHIPYHFSCLIVLPTSSGLDIDAGLKQLLDCCEKGGAVHNDKDCKSLRVEYDDREGVLIKLRDMQVPMPKTLQRSRAKAIAKRAMGG